MSNQLIEIPKQIQNFRIKEERTPKKSKRSKKAKRLHQTSPCKVHSPVVFIIHREHCILRMIHENNRSTPNGRATQSSRRHNSVKSKRSSNRSSAYSTRFAFNYVFTCFFNLIPYSYDLF
eukprot:498996_1